MLLRQNSVISFKRNVTTMVGQHGMKGREDGSYANSKAARTCSC